jgi:hypothetical protein
VRARTAVLLIKAEVRRMVRRMSGSSEILTISLIILDYSAIILSW